MKEGWRRVLIVVMVSMLGTFAYGIGPDEEDLDDDGRAIIEDYDSMWEGDDIDWVWIRDGVELRDYKVDITEFENMAEHRDEDMMEELNEGFQDAFAKAAKRGDKKRTLKTENAVYWTDRANRSKRWIPFAGEHLAQAGVGIEMIFRDSSGEIVAMVRHAAREGDDLEDAAEELVDDIYDWFYDN